MSHARAARTCSALGQGASPDIARLTDRIEVAAEHGVLMICGLAETWAPPFQAAGANGFTSGLVNVLPSLSLAVRDALHAEDFATARAKVRSIAPFEAMRAMQGNGCNVTVVKESLRLLGIEVGDVRPPGTVALSADEVGAGPDPSRLGPARQDARAA